MAADPKLTGSSSNYSRELFGLVHGSSDHPSERAGSRFQWIASHMPTDARTVLDVGSGPGFLTALLSQNGFRVTSVDLVLESLRRFAGARAQADASGLPFADRSFDVVLCAEMVEHLNDSERETVFRELWRVSRRHVLLTVPYRERLRAPLVRCDRCGTTFHPWGHRASFDERRLSQALPAPPMGFHYLLREVHAYHPVLLAVRQRVLGYYSHDDLMTCPGCHNSEIQPGRRSIPVRVLDRLNRWLGYKKQEGWILALYERPGVAIPANAAAENVDVVIGEHRPR